MNIRKEFRENRREAKQLFAVCAPLLIGFILMYNSAYVLVVRPLGKLLWRLALRFSPVTYISNENIFGIYSSPLVLLALVVIGIGFAYWALFNIASILICLGHIRKKIPFSLRGLFRESFLSTLHVFKPKNLPILLFAAVVLPFTNVVMSTNFISDLVIPEYIAEVIHENFLFRGMYWMLMGAAIFLTIRYLFILHFFVLEGCDLPEAVRRNNELIKGKRKSSFFQIIYWKIRVHIKYTLWIILILVAVYAAVALISKGGGSAFVAAYLVEQKVMGPFFAFLFGCLEVFAQYGFITVLFYRYHPEKEAAADILPEPVEQQEEKKRLFSRKKKEKYPFGWLIYGLSAGTVLVSVIGLIGTTFVINETNFLDNMLRSGMAITCHRGDSHAAPENTLPAIQAAIDGGVSQYAEIDVQMTKDGVVVLTHDTSLKRCTGEDVAVHEITFAELKELDAGSFFSEAYVGTQIPSLEEVIELARGEIMLNIEIKNSGHSPELEAAVVQIIREQDFVDQCVVTSISYDTLVKVKEADPEIKTGYIMALGVGNYYDLPCADFFSVESTFITKNMVRELHGRGKEVHAWTIDTERDIEKMIELGVDNVITGNPEMIHNTIHETMDNILFFLQMGASWENMQDYFSEGVFQQLTELYGIELMEDTEDAPELEDGSLEEVMEEILNEA